MTTADTVRTILECSAFIAIILGLVYEEKVIAFEDKIASKIRRVFNKGENK